MIGSFRNFAKTKFAGLLVCIMIIPFVFWGMGSMFSSGGTNTLAKINETNISTQEFIDYLNASGIPQQQIRENLDKDIIEEILSGMVSAKLLELEIGRNLKKRLLEEVFSKSNYSISDAYFYVNELTGHVTFFYQHLTGFINSFIQVAIYSYYLIDSDPTTLIYFLGGMLVLYFPIQAIIRRSRRYTDKAYWVSLNVSEEIAKVVENMYLIKILKKDREEIDSFEQLLKKRDNYGIRTVIWGSLSGYLPTFLTMFVLGILVSFSNVVKNLTIDFIGVTLRLFQQLGAISMAMNNLLNSQIHIKHFNDIDRNRIVDNRERYKIVDQVIPDFSTKFEEVTFQYFNSETPIFENLNFQIPIDRHSLITGPNGSGKSTLLGLLSGVLIPVAGKISVSSKDLGYIGATPFIFKDSLKNNLLYGNEEKIDDQILLEKLYEFDVFKEKENYELDREISNRSLSSGQMQKIAFIRALLSSPRILLLDESTANLDDKSKDLIFDILDKETLTIINSTHDPLSFNADYRVIINLENQLRHLTIDKI